MLAWISLLIKYLSKSIFEISSLCKSFILISSSSLTIKAQFEAPVTENLTRLLLTATNKPTIAYLDAKLANL